MELRCTIPSLKHLSVQQMQEISLYQDAKYIIGYCKDSVIRAKNAIQENAREILANLGQNKDVAAGIFDETMLDLRKCDGFEISREPICCAVSVHHRLAEKNQLAVEDMYGENLMLMHRGWSRYVDEVRDDIWENHNEINIVDFDFYHVIKARKNGGLL